MKSVSLNLVLAACAFHETGAFSGRSPLPPVRPSSATHSGMSVGAPSINERSDIVSLRVASVGNSNSNARSSESPKSHSRTPTLNEQLELEIIRKELIQKYISLGHSEEYAANEVEYFLEDSERSAQYVEMRRVAMARGNDLGIESFVQFGAAFLVGWAASWMMDALHATNTDGGLPWIS